jgi:hypothetical protein
MFLIASGPTDHGPVGRRQKFSAKSEDSQGGHNGISEASASTDISVWQHRDVAQMRIPPDNDTVAQDAARIEPNAPLDPAVFSDDNGVAEENVGRDVAMPIDRDAGPYNAARQQQGTAVVQSCAKIGGMVAAHSHYRITYITAAGCSSDAVACRSGGPEIPVAGQLGSRRRIYRVPSACSPECREVAGVKVVATKIEAVTVLQQRLCPEIGIVEVRITDRNAPLASIAKSLPNSPLLDRTRNTQVLDASAGELLYQMYDQRFACNRQQGAMRRRPGRFER